MQALRAERLAVGTGEHVRLDPVPTRDTRFTPVLAALSEPALAIDRRGVILDVNDKTEAIVGRTRSELIGAPFATVVEAPPGCSVHAHADQHVRFVPGAAGIRLRHAFGSEAVSVLVCPHDARSSIVILRGASKGSARVREDDVAQIAHDFKHPLSLIALEVDVLDRKLDIDHTVDVKPGVARILQNVGFLDRMVHELLDLCSLEAGQLQLRLVPTEMQALLDDVIGRAVDGRDRKRIILDATERVTILVDDLRIERVIANFLTNALKYAPASTGIVVRLDRLPAAVRVSVSDAGPGLTPLEMAYVFDKYRRADAARDIAGTGLGLFVSKQIIEAHHGIIGVDSTRGIGSRFFFELPA